MRGLAKYQARVALDDRATTSMRRLDRALRLRDARKRRGSEPAPPVVTALPALVFAKTTPAGAVSEEQLHSTAVKLIEGDKLLVGHVPGHDFLLAAPRKLDLSQAQSIHVPLLLSDTPVLLFNGTGRVISARLRKEGSVNVYELCASSEAHSAEPKALGLSKKAYRAAQYRAAWLLGAEMSL